MFTVQSYLLVPFCLHFLYTGVFAKKEIHCELAAFIENQDGSDPKRIDSGKTPGEFSNCDEDNQKMCIHLVEQQVTEGTKGGNFSLSLDQEEYTIGDVLCDKADGVEENVQNKMVQIYWRLCGKGWRRTSFRMPEPLCCEDGLYMPCKLNKSIKTAP